MRDFVLDDFLPYRLAVLASRVSAEFSTLYKARFGITIPEWRVVAHLSQTPDPVSVREIFDRVGMDKPKVSRAASRLQASGYVEKAPSRTDRRLVELRLTDKGRNLITEMAPIARSFEADVLRRLGPDAEVFRDSVARLIDNT